MPIITRRSASQQLIQRPSINQNILNRSSDGDIDSKRNSQWWKNLPDTSRRNSILKNSQSNTNSKVLNADSAVTEGDNSQWWKNLSENCTVPLPSKLNSTDEVSDKKDEEGQIRILSQSESDDNEEIFLQKNLFASQEQRPQKSRYSRAFNLNTEKEIEEEQNVVIEELKNQLEDGNSITEFPNSSLIKESKKRKKTKSIFSKKLRKRKFSDAFTVTDNEPEESEQTNKDKHIQNQTSSTENISILKDPTDGKTEHGLFKLNLKNKKYSEAFANLSNDKIVENILEKEIDSEKTDKQIPHTDSSNYNKTVETSQVVETVTLFKANLQKKNSDDFSLSKNIVQENNELSEKEINMDEIQTQTDASYVSNRSLNTSNDKNIHNTIEKTSQKEIHNTKTANTSTTGLSASSSKSEKSENKILRNEKYDSESSDEEIFIEEINTQKEAVESINRSIDDTKGIKKSLFKRDTKSRKYSKAFLDPSASKIGETKEQENDEDKINETISSRQHTNKNLFTLQNKNTQFTNIFEEKRDDENKENNRADAVVMNEHAAKLTKESLKNLKNTKYSQAFLELISMQRSVEETHDVATNSKHNEDNEIIANKSLKETAINEKSDNETKFSSISSIDISEEIKHPLFRPKARKSLYPVKSVTKNIEHSKILSDVERQQNSENNKTQKISAKRFSLRSSSPTESISHFFDESLISSTKLFINPNENKDTGSEGSTKKKKDRPARSVAIIHENPDNASEIDIQKSKDNKDTESEDAIKNKNSTSKTRQKSKLLTILIENPENVSVNQIHMNEENKDNTKNSTSKRGRKPKSIAKYPKNIKNVSSNKLTDDSNTEPEELNKSYISIRGRKSRSESIFPEDPGKYKLKNETINKDNNLEIDELVKNQSITPKKGRITRSEVRATENHDYLVNNDPEYVMKGNIINSKSDELIKNIKSLPKRDRKSKSVTKVSEASKDNTFENETEDDENLKPEGIVKNINSSSKNSRKSKSVTKVSKDTEGSTSENETDDENLKAEGIVNNIKIASKKGRKSKSVTKVSKDPEGSTSENETDDENLKAEGKVKNIKIASKKGRKSKSVTKVSKDPEGSTSENETDDENLKAEGIVKNIKIASKKGRKSKLVTKVSKDPEGSTSENETDDENLKAEGIVKNIKIASKKGRKSKSVTKVSKDPEGSTSENETDDENLKAEGKVKNIKIASKKGRKSKSVTKVSKDPEGSTSENETLDNENLKAEGIIKDINSTSKRGRESKSVTKIFKDSEKNLPTEEFSCDKDSKSNDIIKHKNSTARKSRKSKSGTTILEDQENYLPENDIIIRDELESESNDSVKYKNYTSKRDTKSISESKVIEDLKDNTTDHNDSEPGALVKNKNVTSKKTKKSKSITRVAEDSSENIFKKNSESNEVIKKKKRGKPPKLISTVSDNVDNIENMDLESEKSVKNKNSINNRTRKSSVRAVENYTNDVKDNRGAESKEVRNEYSINRNSSTSIYKNPVENPPETEVLATEERNEDMNNQIKQKTIVSNMPRNLNTVSEVFQKQDISNTVNDDMMSEDISSDETVKRKMLPINNIRKSKSVKNVENHESSTAEDKIFDDNVSEKSQQLSMAEPMQSVIANQGQSSQFRTESMSNIITINSSTSRARSSQFSNINKTRNKSTNINMETWLHRTNTNYVEPKQDNLIENKDIKPSVKRIKTLDGWKDVTASEDSTSSEIKELRKKMLAKAMKDIHQEKQKKSPPQVPVKKITDFFTKLTEDEKLKPIQKKTYKVKQISRSVCTARLINGKPYYCKKLFRGEHWCSPQLYKLLQNKIKNKYGDDTINESERIMKFIVQSVKVVIKSKKYLKKEVDNLKKELAMNGIVSTTYDFFCFCLDYLPTEYRDLVVPCTRAFTTEPNVPYNRDDVFKPIKL